MKTITDQFIATEWESMWAAAHPNRFLISDERRDEMAETYRGLCVLQVWQREGSVGNPLKFMATYSVMESVLLELATKYCGIQVDTEESAIPKTESRADKWSAFMRWASTRVFQQFSTDELIVETGFGYQTTLKYLQESPSFRKIKKGLWEVRDAKADREAERA